MEKHNKISLTGKIIAIIASTLSIVMVSGKWLDLYQVPMIFGNSIPHKYSLFDISKFLDTFSMYLEGADLKVYSVLFFSAAAVIIAVNVLTVSLLVLNKSAEKLFSKLSALIGIIIPIVFLVVIIRINVEMKESTYGAIDELLRATAKPYWLIAFSALSYIGCSIKPKENNLNVLNKTILTGAKRRCTNCGAEIGTDSTFCNSCGAKQDIQTQVSGNNTFCTNCGAQISVNAKFCTKCGHTIG